MLDLLNGHFNDLFDNVLVRKFLILFLFILIIWFVIYFVRKGVEKYITQSEARYRFKKVLSFLGFVLMAILSIVIFTDKLAYFSLSIGLLTAGIAFALQEVIISIAGWIAIITGNIYKTGDRIELNGVKGDVIDIGVMKTTIMEIGGWINSDNYSGRIVKLSNSFVFKGAVNNYSGDFPFLWDEINIPIRYGSDYTLVENILLQVAEEVVGNYSEIALKDWKQMVKKYLIEDATIVPTVAWSATDNWMLFNLRFVVDYKKRRMTKSQMIKRIIEEIDKVKDKVVIASATFELVGMPNINVDLNNSNK